MTGTLHVVATPLGNLDDLSTRARETLAGATLIACEDTRRTSKLLARIGVAAPMVALHKFSERDRLERVLGALGAGGDVALVSDGGTPGISDPGALLIDAAHRAGFRVSPIPGPSAVVALLSASGLPADRFLFEGFLPRRASERRRLLRDLAAESRTVVVYEAPHRIRQSLDDIAAAMGDRTIVLGRELTKVHETILRGSAVEVLAALGEEVRGELTLAIAGRDPSEAPRADGDDAIARAWARALDEAEGDARTALRSAAKALALKRAELWRRLTELGLVRA
ncbi:MAG TPA: 16S rRNA (cytidine(1402)-2'-O)-methyltransferase [Candidatus Polarisedimenticolaceae bacterium]|nr:16S rRNA (cytidine(1402)-2'-O)-methyltransferase [Candidatus Polarisedimenticolaceae bacterium]